MALRDKVKGLAINAFLSGRADRVRRGLDDVRRRIAGEPKRVELYYQVDDPYSYFLAQLLPQLLDHTGAECEVYVVGPPAADAAPEPGLRARYAVHDAAELAGYYQLDFPQRPAVPEDGHVVKANQIMVVDRPVADQLRAARAVSAALFAKDRDALAKAAGEFGSEASANVKPKLAENYRRLRDRGHYWGATLRYGGDWFWGVDRLHYLESELAQAASVLKVRPEAERGPEKLADGDDRLTLEFYHSLRSPYSYLALARVLELPDKYDLDLRIKPVLPMVMRGLQVPRVKRMYIVRDAKREADRLGIPFGNICDPLGDGIGKCLAIYQHAEAAGKGGEFLLSVGRGAWSEALNIDNDGDLETIVDRAGLQWSDAQTAMAADSWEKMAADNRGDLDAAGMWGVPSFQVGTFQAWGQDRIEMLEDRLRRHFAAA